MTTAAPASGKPRVNLTQNIQQQDINLGQGTCAFTFPLFRLGRHGEALLELLAGGTRAAVICNADDYKTGANRIASFQRERTDLESIGLEPIEVDLRDFFGRQAELRRCLMEFDLLWVRGGNSFILRRAMRASSADR